MTAAPTILGTVSSYSDLHDIMRARADQLEVTRETIDAVAGLQPGYAAKLLAPKPIKKMGDLTLGLMLPALGIKLIVVEDSEALEKVRSRLVKREVAPIMLAVSRTNGRHAKKNNIVSKRFMRKIARLGGKAYARTDAKTKRRVAKAGARARWRGNRPKMLAEETAVMLENPIKTG